MKIYRHIEMYTGYLYKNIKKYIKTESITTCTMCRKCIWKNVKFVMF